MNCTDCQNQFSDFIDDEISLKLARSFKSHIAACSTCRAEWQLFQQTIATLQSFPVQKVPAGFIMGIHEKIEQQPLAKLQGWFSFLTQHKLTFASSLAALMVGIIGASVLQLSPLDSEQTLAHKDNSDNIIIQAMTVDTNQTNYYPGTPYLAQNSANTPLPIPRNRIQSTPVTQSAPTGGHNSILDSRRSANLSHSAFSNPALSHLGTTSPDLAITVHARSAAYQHALIRQLIANQSWQTQISGNSLLVTLPSNQLTTFQNLFAPIDPHINPNVLSRLSKLSSASRLTIAVAFH